MKLEEYYKYDLDFINLSTVQAGYEPWNESFHQLQTKKADKKANKTVYKSDILAL